MRASVIKNKSNYWEVIWMLAKTDLKMRYQGSWLGAVWVFLKPFCLFLILNFVFSSLFYENNPTYTIRLLVGLILWFFFSEATTVGMNSLLSKSDILRKIYIPKWIIIISATVHSGLAFCFNAIILFLFLIGYQVFPDIWHLLIFFIYVVLIYGISLTFSFFAAPLIVRFRDLNQIWEVLLQVLFYASPIIYPITAVPPKVQTLLYINPMTLLIEHSKVALVDHGVARVDHLLIFIAIFIPCFVGSMLYLKSASRNLIENM
ncbi:MAG TPA: ABC transporter permease [Bacteroidales bacterium]|nr:ABC transporter permease [Bacteroidales bacterium]HPS50469.1 ABC transporter permease [Bacteroidales bacterium]